MIKNLLLIGTGGFLGSIARYLVSQLNLTVSFHSIPVGTLTVNVAGSFLIGFLTGIAEKSMILTPEWRLFLMVGLCGGFTTFRRSPMKTSCLFTTDRDWLCSFIQD